VIVADANLVVHLVWPSDQTPAADAVWSRDPVWVAPPLYLAELRSAVGVAVRQRTLAVDVAVAMIERAQSMMHDAARPVSSRTVLELSRDTGCSTYDCEYVALATALGVRLVTSERGVLRAFPKVAISPADFAASGP